MEKETATHSSVLAWRIPWTEEPGGPQPVGSQKGRTELSNQTAIADSLYCTAETNSIVNQLCVNNNFS